MNGKTKDSPPPIYVVSGGRGLAGNNMVQSLLIQYPNNKIPVVIIPGVNSENQLFDLLPQVFSFCRVLFLILWEQMIE